MMNARIAVVREWGKRASASIGLGGAIAAGVIFLVLLPFDVIAVTRLTGWDWAIALGAVIALNLIPVAGQIAMIGLAVAGAFYAGQDNLAMRKAAPAVVQPAASKPLASPVPAAPVAPVAAAAPAPSPAPPTVSTVLSDPFLDWKKNTAGPAVQNSCIQDAQRRGLVDSSQIEKMARACACYGAAAVNVITPADVVDGQVKPTPEFNERLGIEAKRICQG